MKITKTINKATVKCAKLVVTAQGAQAEEQNVVLLSCDELTEAKAKKLLQQKVAGAQFISMTQKQEKYSIEIEEFVKVAHVEQ